MCRQKARAMCGEAGFAAILDDPRVEAVVLVLPPSVALEVRSIAQHSVGVDVTVHFGCASASQLHHLFATQ